MLAWHKKVGWSEQHTHLQQLLVLQEQLPQLHRHITDIVFLYSTPGKRAAVLLQSNDETI